MSPYLRRLARTVGAGYLSVDAIPGRIISTLQYKWHFPVTMDSNVQMVLAICPHASIRAIERDLSITNSVPDTINRILDGVVEVSFTADWLTSLSSLHCSLTVTLVVVNSNNSAANSLWIVPLPQYQWLCYLPWKSCKLYWQARFVNGTWLIWWIWYVTCLDSVVITG